ncbi:MAG TPA: hypothetical protein VH254_02895 [Candidatus Udaeobacter sp.]|jgi:hypothetical protein|nr:hypothetical protein [Candidatus Udaeobacter sp.]
MFFNFSVKPLRFSVYVGLFVACLSILAIGLILIDKIWITVPAYRFLHSAHDDAVMTARRFRINEIRALLLESSFAIRRLTYWTTLLFPFAVLARTLGWSRLDAISPRREDHLVSPITFATTMALERGLLKKLSFPFGMALLAAATKRVVSQR